MTEPPEETRSPDFASSKPAVRFDALGEASLRSQSTYSPAEMLKRARAEYARGHYSDVVRMLEVPAQELSAAAQRVGNDTSGTIREGRSAASAWALLARAAARSRRPEAGASAASQAVQAFRRLREQGAALSDEELNDYGISLYLANEVNEAADIMRQAVARHGATPETHLYQGLVELRRGQLGDALTALEEAEAVEGRDLQKLRVETLVDLFEKLGADRGDELALVSFQLADIHYRAGEYSEALMSLDRALVITPQDATLLAARGETLRQLGRFDEALTALDQAIALKPNNARTLGRKGETLRQLGRFDDALSALDQAIALEPNDAWTLSRKGQTLRQLGRFDEALRALDQAIALEPTYAWALAVKGEMLRQMGRFAEALNALDQVIASEPNNACALGRKGETLRQLGRFDDALSALDQAIALEPNDAWTLSRKGQTLRQLGRLDEALPALDQAIALEPTFAWALAVKGETLRQMGRLEEALSAVDQAIVLEPTYASALSVKGETLRQLGRFAEALNALDQVIASEPNNAWALGRKGETLRQIGRLDEALSALDQAIASKPNDEWNLVSKGQVLLQMQRNRDAEDAFRAALKLDPGNSLAKTALGHALLNQDQEQEALHTLEQVLEHNSDFVWALEGKAHALFNLDDIDASMAVIQRRLEIPPEDAWSIGVHGAMLFLIEEYTDATLELERSTSVTPDIAWVQRYLSHCYGQLSIRSLPPEAVPYEEKSLAAAGEAVKLEPEKLASHSALAASLMRLGGERRADGLAEYRWVLEAARGKQRLEYSDLLSAGWAAFRLASHEAMDTMSLLAEAERLNVEALAIKKDRPTSSDAIEVRFNLALTLLCSKRFGLALNEYDDILRLVREKQPRVARGLLGRARTDIEQSLAEWPQLNGVSHAKRALESLKKGYSEAQQRLMAELEGIQFPSSTLPHSAAAAAGL